MRVKALGVVDDVAAFNVRFMKWSP
jgi:hypothetical protein